MPGPTPNGLFAGQALRRRSWAAVATSTSLHIAALIGAAVLARGGPAPTLPRERRPLTFVMIAPPPVPHEPTRALALPVSRAIRSPEPERLAPVETPKPEAPLPAPKALAPSEPAPALPQPPRTTPPAIAPPQALSRTPPPPPVTVGLFTDSAPTVHEAAPIKTVRDAGFDAPSPIANSGEITLTAVVGAFDSVGPPARSARPGTVVASAGFGSSRAEASSSTRPPADVRPSGFDAVRPAPPPAPRAAPALERVDFPVEILFKPAPIYTEEARRLKVEGDVLLDVEFAATGAVSVLQVVRGLGHGLDEAATTAAKQIRFKAAQTAGRPISFRTTVHIVFRLA